MARAGRRALTRPPDVVAVAYVVTALLLALAGAVGATERPPWTVPAPQLGVVMTPGYGTAPPVRTGPAPWVPGGAVCTDVWRPGC